MMFRFVYSMLFLAVSTVSLLGGQSSADEVIQEAKSQPEETSVSFERRQFTVSRHKGKILFDGTESPRHILGNKSKEVRLIETFDGLQFATDKAFIEWGHKLKGTRTYTYDEVTRVFSDGATVTQPLVFFDKEQRNDLDTKWHAWLDERQAEIEKMNQSRLAQEQEAKRYQLLSTLQEHQTQAISAHAAAAERSADSLAVVSGETSLWEVELVPSASYGICTSCTPNFGGTFFGSQSTGLSYVASGSRLNSTFGINYNYGNRSNSIYVRAYGRTSQVASSNALDANPGYRAGSIRKLAGY